MAGDGPPDGRIDEPDKRDGCGRRRQALRDLSLLLRAARDRKVAVPQGLAGRILGNVRSIGDVPEV